MKTVVRPAVLKATVVDGLASVLVLTGFHVVHHRVVTQVKAVNAAAQAHLAAAPAASFTLRLDDPDHGLEHAMVHTTDEPLTPAQAHLSLGISLTVVVSRALPGETPDLEVLVRSRRDVLLDVRGVHGTVYLRLGWSALRRAAEAGAPGAAGSLDQAAAGLGNRSAVVAELMDDVRAGKWLALDTSRLLGGGFPDAGSAAGPGQEAWDHMTRVLHKAVSPHVEVHDLVTSGGRQTIHVDVRAKALLLAVMKELSAGGQGTSIFPGMPVAVPKLSGMSGATVHSTLTFDRGHYSQLRVPLADLFALDAHPARNDPKPQDLGHSALVLDVNDHARRVAAPPASQVSDVDLAGLFQQVLSVFAQGFAGTSFGG